MKMETATPPQDEKAAEILGAAFSEKLAKLEPTPRERVLRKVILAALGSIPWVGGFMAALASIKDDKAQTNIDDLQRQWLEEHGRKIQELASTLSEMIGRLESFGAEVRERIESDEYLALIRKGFRQWDQADTTEKKKLIANLLTNAGATNITSDDVIRLFLDWINIYHEIHFSVIREVYRKPGITRAGIWLNIQGEFPREDSAEADLFKLLVRDLTMGGVIRQHRDTTYDGRFIAKKAVRSGTQAGTMKSAFDSKEPYELTEFGRQFVHYTMEEVVPRIAPPPHQQPSS